MRRPAETKSVLSPSPDARMAASSFVAAPLKRKTATTTSSIPSEIAKNYVTGPRLILSLIPRILSCLFYGALVLSDTVEGRTNPGLAASAGCPKGAGYVGCFDRNKPDGRPS